MGWGGKENSAFIWDRHRAWGWERKTRSVPEDEETQAHSKMPFDTLSGCTFAKLLNNLGASTPWIHNCLPVGDRDGGGLSFPSTPSPWEPPQAPTSLT